MGARLTEDFLHLFVEKNSNGTRNLRLKGKELHQRIGKRLVASDMRFVARFLKDNPDILQLDMSYNDFGDAGLDNFIKNYLSKENELEYLNIMSCNLSHVGIASLISALPTIQLKTLRLAGNKLGAESGRFLAKLIESCNTLDYLDVGDTDQTIFSVCGILSRLTDSSVKRLNISRVIPTNMYIQTNSAELCIGMAQVLEYNINLVELHMQKCELDGHDIELLIEGLSLNDTLELLDIGYNKFGDHGMELLARWLRERPNLIGINVAGNFIQDNGARMLGLCMPSSRIRFLDISYNKITDKGMASFLYSVKKPYKLRILYIWGNLFGPPTNKIIQRMLKSNVLSQEFIDVKIYIVDKVPYAAYYPTNHYKHRYYDVMDHGCAPELKIIKHDIAPENSKPRALLDFAHIDRYPVVTEKYVPSSTSAESESLDSRVMVQECHPIKIPENYLFIGTSVFKTSTDFQGE